MQPRHVVVDRQLREAAGVGGQVLDFGRRPAAGKRGGKLLEGRKAGAGQGLVTCGLAAKIIAEHLRLSPSELFIDGLIHDIGKIAMLLAFPSEYSVLRDISSQDHAHCATEEKNRFGISHDEAGLQLARRWLLPEQLMMAIGYHHTPQDAPACIERPLIIQVADILSLMHNYSDSMEAHDVERIFTDFFPEISSLWQRNQLQWAPENLGLWFYKLVQTREDEQGILSIFTSS